MANEIEEAYVSFETAKLLKDKGFDALCTTFYYVDTPTGKVIHQFQNDENEVHYVDINEYPCAILAPTQSLVMRWLREKHKLHCSVVLKDVTEDTYVYSIADLGDDRHWIRGEYLEYPSYEEACEAAIKYCLENLI